MPVTIEDISARLGISIATVSKALNDYPDVSAKTRKLVQETALKMGYQPSASARNLRRGRTEKIGLLINHSLTYISEYLSEIMSGIARTAEQNGKNIILYTETVKQPDGLIKICRSGEIDGALLLWANPTTSMLALMTHEKLPYVVLGRRVEYEQASYVAPDNVTGAYQLTCHLIEQGHRRIGFMRRQLHGPTNIDRFAGYERAHQDAGIPIDPALIVNTEIEPNSGYNALLQLLDLPQPPSAVFTFHDLMGVDALRAASDRNLSVPGDIAIVGFDGLRSSEITNPRLTTVKQPLAAMGQRAVEILLTQIKSPDMPPQQHVFPVELMIRESS
ncbi:MAG: LacI family DNA-binding transcriptional regulator [Anaerolineae bacterium]|nr:LacI family DNA-binding transcriptional regulator [Anaerolineae bacterium]